MPSIRLLLIKCLITPFAFLPLKWNQFIGSYLGLLLIKHNKKRAHIALANIHACFPNKTIKEQETLLKMTAMEAGKWFMESPYIWFRHPSYLASKVTISNPELLAQAHQKGRGVILVLPHQGNWELLNFYVPQHYPFGAMYRPSNSPLLERIIFNGRSRLGGLMFAANTRGVRQALKALKKNTVVAILSDHLPSEEAGVHAPFFGHPALTGKLTHSLVRHNSSEILLASVIRQPQGEGFTIHFNEIKGMDTDNSVEAATAMNQAIESSILLAPEQYQWVYRRFAKPPIGVKSIYTDC
jgi:KDO2-lipid IV(A) lauroyltransferase